MNQRMVPGNNTVDTRVLIKWKQRYLEESTWEDYWELVKRFWSGRNVSINKISLNTGENHSSISSNSIAPTVSDQNIATHDTPMAKPSNQRHEHEVDEDKRSA